MSNITGDDQEGSFSSAAGGGGGGGEEEAEVVQIVRDRKNQDQLHAPNLSSAPNNNSASAGLTNSNDFSSQQQQQPVVKKKRNLPGTPDPNAEVIALSPTTLMATNRFVCEICSKGFQRDQNLQLHRRGHNLPWKLRQRTSTEMKKRVYICPEPTCVHHNPGRALGDLTGIKKHFSRKHGEKKWKCDKCSKKYAVQSDWKAHLKTCGTREYKCDCGTIFSRRDSFITHRAFCDALAEENKKVNMNSTVNRSSPVSSNSPNTSHHDHHHQQHQHQIPDFIPSISINTPLPIISDHHQLMINSNMNNSGTFHHESRINPLKSLPQEFVPIPFKPMNMSTSTSIPSTSIGGKNNNSNSNLFQLSSSTSFSTQLHDSKNGCQVSSSPMSSIPMSATALLQKAAQMGAATASNGTINSPMMAQKNFVSSMAGPDYRANNHGNNVATMHNNMSISYLDHNHFQSNMVGIMNQSSSMMDMGIFSQMMMMRGSHYHHPNQNQNQNLLGGCLKNVTEEDDTTSSSNLRWLSTFEGSNNGGNSNNGCTRGNHESLTLNLLGEGGGGLRVCHGNNLIDDHHHEEAETLPINVNPFQQQVSHDHSSAIDKSMWEV